MKKIILLLLATTSLICNGQSRNNLIFKVAFKPETNYNMTTKQTTENTIQYIGSEEFFKKLKDKGIQNPTITNTFTTTESVYKIGKLTDRSNFPLTIEFIKTTSSDGKKPIPDGMIIYGQGSIDKAPVLDSVGSTVLDQKVKDILLQAIQITIKQLYFTERTVTVGDSFSVESPLTIPVGNMTIDMVITTNYKLLSIKNNVGYFDVSQFYTAKSAIKDDKIHVTGTGKGKLLYDVVNNYNLKYQVDLDMQMDMTIDDFNIVLKSKKEIIQITEMSKNSK